MLVRNKSAFIKGVILTITFGVVLVLMFLPLFNGDNALRAADDLFNSISKGSTNFIPDLLKKNEAFKGTAVSVKLGYSSETTAENAAKILSAAGASAQKENGKLTVSGDLNQILAAALTDSGKMFANNEEPLREKYGLSGKEAMYTWWYSLKEMDKDLTRQHKFKEAAFIAEVMKKGVEVGYNFFGIKSMEARNQIGMLTFAMIFYVVYTLWWGVAILYLFEGIGMQLKHSAKKEV
ncbi:MAG: hypothetical protein RDU20_10450 [Desulfomonilaceae bacterium]|nr:hypothetical protein [Desulfomonilaceae bacterium]